MKKFNVGIIGCGAIANQYIKNAKEVYSDYFTITVLGDLRIENAQKYAEQYEIEKFGPPEMVYDDPTIDLIINLEPWVQGKMYDRLGLDKQVTEILGIKIPSITIPVKPGRNLAIILEIAAMNNRQKKMGYNTAEEFNKKLMGQMGLD